MFYVVVFIIENDFYIKWLVYFKFFIWVFVVLIWFKLILVW